MMRKMALVLFLGGVLFVFVGCSKVTRENWEMIKVGASTKLEVENTLGKEYKAHGDDQWQFENEDKDVDAMIYFDGNGKVVKKQWRDGNNPEWITVPPEPSEGRKIYEETNTTTIHKG